MASTPQQKKAQTKKQPNKTQNKIPKQTSNRTHKNVQLVTNMLGKRSERYACFLTSKIKL